MFKNVSEYANFRGFKIHPDNIPLKKPGAYGIYCLPTGKWYIRISQNIFSRARVHQKIRGKGRLKSAFKCYGLNQFVFFPLVYSIDGTDWLPALEAELIVTFDSFKNGYNLIAKDNTVGPYGAEFVRVIKAALADPEVRKRIGDGTRRGLLAIGGRKGQGRKDQGLLANGRQKKDGQNFDYLRTPDRRAAMSASTRRAWADPEARARRMRNKLIAAAKPEVRQKISIATRGTLKRPAVKAKHSATVTGYVWITDGKEDKWVDPSTTLPAGWRFGRALLGGRRWITNHVKSKMILPSDPIPEGWVLGRTMRRGLTPREEGE